MQDFAFLDDDWVARNIDIGDGPRQTSLPRYHKHADPRSEFLFSFLGAKAPQYPNPDKGRITYIDLFSGGGGLSLGVQSGLKSLGFSPRLLAAVDLDPLALSLVSKRFRPLIKRAKKAEELVSFAVDHSGNFEDFITNPSITDPQIEQFKGKVSLLVGGPPCQGHSTLNNKTRGFDPRNLLYYVMPAFAVALDVPVVIIENVRNIAQARENIVELSRKILITNGYNVQDLTLNAADYGVAQNRLRHFFFAYKGKEIDMRSQVDTYKGNTLSFNDVNSGLPPLGFKSLLLESNPELSQQNVDRIEYLHQNDLYELPNAHRPDCHKDGHTYPSVYGRVRPDEPVGTIT
ncbi:MAG: DNA cytosine methyltransferase, partial [Candidatus Thiodiazotropha endolucinida]|nr:DNA cytosine methyltransferase [Candidatus Thiodiazotropha taylori]MCW4322491.1 DNA cytosine methyltransferase [Candidatus Thiodiazotropha taylori]